MQNNTVSAGNFNNLDERLGEKQELDWKNIYTLKQPKNDRSNCEHALKKDRSFRVQCLRNDQYNPKMDPRSRGYRINVRHHVENNP